MKENHEDGFLFYYKTSPNHKGIPAPGADLKRKRSDRRRGRMKETQFSLNARQA